MCVYLCRLQPWLVGAQFASPSCCSMASWQRRRCRPTNAMAGGSSPPRSRLNGGRFGPLLIEGPSCCVWTHQVCTSQLSSADMAAGGKVLCVGHSLGGAISTIAKDSDLWLSAGGVVAYGCSAIQIMGHCISCIDYMPSPIHFGPPPPLSPRPCYHPRPLPHALLTLWCTLAYPRACV